jgi:hypothetical protein
MEQRSKPALLVGDYVPLRSRNDILTFKRVWHGEEVLVAPNVASQPRKLAWPDSGTLLFSTYLDIEKKPMKVEKT